MKKKVSSRIKKFFSCSDIETGSTTPSHSNGVDVREEYAHTFRTESYLDFWTRVIELSDDIYATQVQAELTTSARLPSYRLFAEYLLDPDQPTATQILALARNRPSINTLLSDYFAQTANASILCGLLLKDVEKTRAKYHSFRATLLSLETTKLSPINYFPIISIQSPELSNSITPIRIKTVQSSCTMLLQRLESRRDKTRAKLQLVNKLKLGSALVIVALTTSLSVIIVTHALSFLVAMPTIVSASIELASSRKLARVTAQLDAAAKGTYILSRDLDTISHLVARLNDELEHIRATAKFWVERKDQDWLQTPSGEVARQLKKNESSFNDQLDELEEHLYLCFMTINRARNIVVKEILSPIQSTKYSCILSSK